MSDVAQPTELAMQSLADAQQLALEGRDAACSLLELVRAHNDPAQLRVIELTQARPIWHDEVRLPARSLGVINPTGYILRLGFAGGTAQPGARGIPVPANGALVLPVMVDDLDVGLDDPTAVPVDITVVAYALRFPTVQPFFESHA